MAEETMAGGGFFTESGRHYTVKPDTAPRFEVRVAGNDRGEPYPSYAAAGVGMTASGNIVVVQADRAQTFREIGEALIAAADRIEATEVCHVD